MNSLRLLLMLVFIFFLIGCEHPEKVKKSEFFTSIETAVAHPERPLKDSERDDVRAPQKVLEFFDVKRGDQVLELMAADGYYTELLSRCVGENGKVYMQNNQKFYEFQTDRAVSERLADNRLTNVVRWDQELSNLNLEENSVDKLLMILVLHDFYWMEKDVGRVIQQAYKTLKAGGLLGIIDHSAPANSGIKHAVDMNGIHRIEKDTVIKTMLEHGFIFDAESNALSHSNDDGTKAFFSHELKGKPTDRFMLRFKKPNI